MNLSLFINRLVKDTIYVQKNGCIFLGLKVDMTFISNISRTEYLEKTQPSEDNHHRIIELMNVMATLYNKKIPDYP